MTTRNDQLLTEGATSERMKRVRRRDTGPELQVRKIARSLGLAYRIRNPDLPGSPDLANRSKKWAIFVNGCFWHGHHQCRRAKLPERNSGYWQAKISRNRIRDKVATEALEAAGYTVVVVWECELREPLIVRTRIKDLVA